MFEWFVAILIFLGVIAVTAVLFGGWLIVSIVRLIVRMVTSLAGADAPPADARGRSLRCGNAQCLAPNAAGARFCRRCGTPVRTGEALTPPPLPTRATAPQAAVWL
jgi:hypothetical protein